MTINNNLLVTRKVNNHFIQLRNRSNPPGGHTGGSLTTVHNTHAVDMKVNRTNGIKGIGTHQGYVPRVKESPAFVARDKNILEDFKSMKFGPKKKTNIKLKL